MRGAAVGKRSWQKYHGQGRGGHTDVAGGALDLHAYTGTAGSASAVEKTSWSETHATLEFHRESSELHTWTAPHVKNCTGKVLKRNIFDKLGFERKSIHRKHLETELCRTIVVVFIEERCLELPHASAFFTLSFYGRTVRNSFKDGVGIFAFVHSARVSSRNIYTSYKYLYIPCIYLYLVCLDPP